MVVDRNGVPLTVNLTAANIHDSVVFKQLVEAIPAIKQPRGRPRQRPVKLHADLGYDNPRCRRQLLRTGISCRIARRGIESSARLRRHR